jgi:hypothetical protein
VYVGYRFADAQMLGDGNGPIDPASFDEGEELEAKRQD